MWCSSTKLLGWPLPLPLPLPWWDDEWEDEKSALERDRMPSTGDPGREPGRDAGGVVEGLPFLDQGAATAVLEAWATLAFATRSYTWFEYDGSSSCWTSACASPERPNRRARVLADAVRASSAREGASTWIGRAHRSSEVCPSGFEMTQLHLILCVTNTG